MLVTGFAAGIFAANCYLVAAGPGGAQDRRSECVIIDPGEGAADGIAELLEHHRLTPAGVLLTHGHLDHVWSAAAVCTAYDVACWVHPADRHLLSDPLAGLPKEWAQMLPTELLAEFVEPADTRELADGVPIEVAGLRFEVDHAPGHTPGSVVYRVAGSDSHTNDGTGGGDAPELLFSGDLLFAGSIGRTDLPGGDHSTMRASLARTVLAREDHMAVLPGHGDQTTIGQERASNPFLADMPDPTR